jgi:hypothetical protein
MLAGYLSFKPTWALSDYLINSKPPFSGWRKPWRQHRLTFGSSFWASGAICQVAIYFKQSLCLFGGLSEVLDKPSSEAFEK